MLVFLECADMSALLKRRHVAALQDALRLPNRSEFPPGFGLQHIQRRFLHYHWRVEPIYSIGVSREALETAREARALP